MSKCRVTDMHDRMAGAQADFGNGDATAFKALWSDRDDVTIFGAFGGHAQGRLQLGERLDWAASKFRSATWEYEPISSVFGADVGCTVWIERSTGTIGGRAITQELRVTHVLRLEGDAWRIVHRHADPLVDTTDPSAAQIEGTAT